MMEVLLAMGCFLALLGGILIFETVGHHPKDPQPMKLKKYSILAGLIVIAIPSPMLAVTHIERANLLIWVVIAAHCAVIALLFYLWIDHYKKKQ